MDAREAWKFGFLKRCAEEALSDVQIAERIRRASKQADESWPAAVMRGVRDTANTVSTVVNPVAGAAKTLGSTVVDYGLPVAGLGAIGTGAGLGFLAARMHNDDADPEEVRRRELIEAYRHYTARLQPPPKA
jgi:hypothetical protein